MYFSSISVIHFCNLEQVLGGCPTFSCVVMDTHVNNHEPHPASVDKLDENQLTKWNRSKIHYKVTKDTTFLQHTAFVGPSCKGGFILKACLVPDCNGVYIGCPNWRLQILTHNSAVSAIDPTIVHSVMFSCWCQHWHKHKHVTHLREVMKSWVSWQCCACKQFHFSCSKTSLHKKCNTELYPIHVYCWEKFIISRKWCAAPW